MISILIDAAVLMYFGQEVGFLAAFGVAIAAAIVTLLLTFGLMLLMGIGGIVVAAVLVAALLGLAVAMLFGVELKARY